jgi:hypothetical protein
VFIEITESFNSSSARCRTHSLALLRCVRALPTTLERGFRGLAARQWTRFALMRDRAVRKRRLFDVDLNAFLDVRAGEVVANPHLKASTRRQECHG